jgi:NAD(P)-dependent dehydrogenase (short-subunit alcohol dehydrogenase family)
MRGAPAGAFSQQRGCSATNCVTMQTFAAGNVALVTGGSRGIGAGIVRSLHAAGLRVFFTYVAAHAAAEELVRELDAERVGCAPADLADSDALPALVEACTARFGRLDVLVNNAGMFAENPFDGASYDAWRAGWAKTFAVNLFGAADLTWLALRAMRANVADANGTRGRIITITSRAGHRGELTFADYGASKAAAGNLTKSIARGCAREGIVAFSVAPGFISTEMAAEAIERYGDAIRAEIPGGRIGSPGDVAGIVTFLASGAADYATGSTIDVNGASYVR